MATVLTTRLHPGYSLQLYAAEPDVVDPVAMTFDAEGKAYVVEMRDYPYGFGPDRKPGGTLRLLEDRDGDGRVDHSSIFATNLSFATSVLAWKGGVIVLAPPDLLFFRDHNGDGVADERTTLLTGIRLGVTDSNASGLRWALNNRIQVVNGGNGGHLTNPRLPGAELDLGELDFEFDPESGRVWTTYPTSGGFGLALDAWGHSFATHNVNHIQQRILPIRYLRRFPGLPPIDTTTSISDHGEAARIYPIVEAVTRVNHPEQAGYFSSSGGIGSPGQSRLPGDLATSLTVCDVVGNLVHRDVLVENGPIYRAARSESETNSEFFASTDPAFRPVGLEPGPDGALYLIDMQRDVIEHPDYIPEKVRKKLDLRAGHDRGRIYRLVHPGSDTRPVLPGTRRVQEQVALLAHLNAWVRFTVQRLLIESPVPDALPAIRRLARSDREPLGQIHALWILNGWGKLDFKDLLAAAGSREPGVREQVPLLAEPRLKDSPLLQDLVCQLAHDPHPRVRFQAALSLGEAPVTHTTQSALEHVLIRDLAHPWSRKAVLASLDRGADQFLLRLLRARLESTATRDALPDAARELADLVGARASLGGPAAVLAALSVPNTLSDAVRLAILRGLSSGFSRAGAGPSHPVEPGILSSMDRVREDRNLAIRAIAIQLGRQMSLPDPPKLAETIRTSATEARDPKLNVEERRARIGMLALGRFEDIGPTLLALLAASEPVELQRAALDALRPIRHPALGSSILNVWRTLSPLVRPDLLNLLLSRRESHPALLDAIETGRVPIGELNLDLEQRRRLLRHSTVEAMKRASALMGDEEYSNRKGLVEEWLAKLPASGNATRGRATFEKTCAGCHAVGGIGTAVGPDLTDLSHRSVEDLASNILDPNMAINPNYISWALETRDGESINGILQAQSPQAVTLLLPQGRKVTIPRDNIRSLQSTTQSLMPEGLEAGMSPQDLRDLIAFLQQRR